MNHVLSSQRLAETSKWQLLWAALFFLGLLIVPLDPPGLIRVCVGTALLAALAMRLWDLLPTVVLFGLLAFAPMFYPVPLQAFPTIPELLSVVLTFFVCMPFARRGGGQFWARRGENDISSYLLVGMISIVFALIFFLLSSWGGSLSPGPLLMHELKTAPLWFLVLIGIPAFAFLNSFAKVVIFQGFLQSSLERVFPGRWLLILGLQAAVYAIIQHPEGISGGAAGFFLALSFGLSLGYLRFRTGGLYAPFLAHFIYDLVIGITLVLLI